tara:strand:- start:15675 stop:16148 length:474 start_codon:yes stop_codon:yes gene_type:complete
MAVKTISGSNLILGVDLTGGTSFTAIGGSTACTLNINQETIDISNKGSNGNKEFMNGARSWSIDCEAYFTDGDTTSTDIPIRDGDGSGGGSATGWYPSLEAGTKINVQFSTTTGQAGATKYTGDGYITSISLNGAIGEWSTYSVSIQGTGSLIDSDV